MYSSADSASESALGRELLNLQRFFFDLGFTGFRLSANKDDFCQETIESVCNHFCFWSGFLAKIAALNTCAALLIFKAFHRSDVNSRSSTDFGGKELSSLQNRIMCLHGK